MIERPCNMKLSLFVDKFINNDNTINFDFDFEFLSFYILDRTIQSSLFFLFRWFLPDRNWFFIFLFLHYNKCDVWKLQKSYGF